MPEAVKINSTILKSLRNHYGLSVNDLAVRSKVATELITEWEAGPSEVEITQLAKLSRPLRRNWTVFLLDSIELPDAIKRDNRSVGNQKIDQPILESVLALERAERLLKFAPEIKRQKGLQLPDFSISRNDDPEDKGEEFRKLLGITKAKQLTLQTNYQALNFWKDTINDLGIYIAEMPLPNETIKAFSMMDKGEAIIVVSTKDTVYSRIFSLFHELCHILLNQSNGICDLHTGDSNVIETYCNYFAASFLLGRQELAKDLKRLGIKDGQRPPDSVVARISRLYNVSPLVVYRRLVSTGHLTNEQYSVIHDDYMANYWSYKDAQDKAKEEKEKSDDKSDYFPFYRIAVNSRGKRFIQDVFSANAEGKISYRDIGTILDVTQKQIPKLKETAFNSSVG